MRSLQTPDRWGCMCADRGTRGAKTTIGDDRYEGRKGRETARMQVHGINDPYCWCARPMQPTSQHYVSENVEWSVCGPSPNGVPIAYLQKTERLDRPEGGHSKPRACGNNGITDTVLENPGRPHDRT